MHLIKFTNGLMLKSYINVVDVGFYQTHLFQVKREVVYSSWTLHKFYLFLYSNNNFIINLIRKE